MKEKNSNQPTVFAIRSFHIFFASNQTKKIEPIPKNKLIDCAINTLYLIEKKE